MSIDLAPNNPYKLSIATPIIAAAGSLGYGMEVARHMGLGVEQPTHGLGALITRSTSLRQHRARPLPGIVETPAGLLYRGIDHNPGLKVIRERFAPIWATWNLPVIVSLWGQDHAEVAEAAAQLEGVEGVSGIEIPLSNNNATNIDVAARLVLAVRMATALPLLVKLPGQASDIPGLARAVVEQGADAIALIDGIPAVAPLPDGTLVEGRLCGPAVAPVALGLIASVAHEVNVPIIGVGGVRTAADARAMFAAGANVVGIASGLLNDLRIAANILEDLQVSV